MFRRVHDDEPTQDVPLPTAVPHDSGTDAGRPGRHELLGRLGAAVQAALPGHWSAEVRRTPLRRALPATEDARLVLAGPDGQSAAVAVLLSEPEPRDVSRLAARARGLADASTVVVAPFLSPRTRDRLAEAGLGYADATGSLRLAVDRPAIFLERSGATRDPYPRPRRLHSLRGPATARIVRALLDLQPPHGVRALAGRAGVPPATAARVLDLLDRESLVDRDARGRVVDVPWEALVRRWAEDRGPSRALRRVALGRPGALAAMEALRTLEGGYAVTGDFAATGTSHGAIEAYTLDADRIADALDLSPTPDGGLVLIEPDDDVALERALPRFGLVCAALPQVAADLLARRDPLADRLLSWMASNEHSWRR